MRYFLALSFLLVCGYLSSQNFRYYRPGQNFTPADNNCLLIRNEPKTLAALNQVNRYTSFKAIKLVGFDEPGDNLDSLFVLFAASVQASTLIIENCDLLDLRKPLTGFKKLEELQLLNCDLDEQELFPLLKNMPLKKIRIQQPNPELALDSLYLLPQLGTLQVSDSRVFAHANKTETIYFITNHVRRGVGIAYFGSLYKEAKAPLAASRPVVAAQPTSKKISGVSLTCIRQPLPGVNINDTVYYYNASSAGNFIYQSGSSVSIDKDAFVSVGGETYRGKVQLFYREFRNPVEIMLSGIPMVNMVDGKPQIFRSGGMYEINAYDSKGNELRARTDTSIKINFALTDTSANFNFYSLSNNGSWTAKQAPVTGKSKKDTAAQATKAVKEYYYFLTGRNWSVPDTTRYEDRFESDKYLVNYRKDNLPRNKDSVIIHGRLKGLFRIKYVRRTRDKNIVFMIVPYRSDSRHVVPRYIRPLLNKYFLYQGALTREEFRKIYNKKQRLWDMRITASGDALTFNIKTDSAYLSLSGTHVLLKDDGTYTVQKRYSTVMVRIFQRTMQREARIFDQKQKLPAEGSRFSAGNYNNMYNGYASQPDKQLAGFRYCQKYQVDEELKMDFAAWKKYVSKFPMYYYNHFQYNNEVGQALVKSDLGVKNIDCYLHSGQMETILARYDLPADSLNDEYNAMLFKSINTSYPMERSSVEPGSLSGYYFKQQPNYLIRFSEDGFMQVTRPEELDKLKNAGKVQLAYIKQYNVKGLNSKAITSLIMD